jgi:hypothetical protein
MLTKLQERLLLNNMIAGDWGATKAMVCPGLPGVFLDMVVMTAEGGISLTGKAHSLAGSWEEVFSLTIRSYSRTGWWEENEMGLTRWTPRYLSDEWKTLPIHGIMTKHRDVHFYSSSRFRTLRNPVACLLDDCAAIEFAKSEMQRLVVAASQDHPCCLDIGTTKDECDALLQGLTRIRIDLS